MWSPELYQSLVSPVLFIKVNPPLACAFPSPSLPISTPCGPIFPMPLFCLIKPFCSPKTCQVFQSPACEVLHPRLFSLQSLAQSCSQSPHSKHLAQRGPLRPLSRNPALKEPLRLHLYSKSSHTGSRLH